MQLSVIIVNYNVRDFLENALVSIQKALASLARAGSGPSGEIFVVDNGSDDGSVELVRTKFPDVHLIVNKENLGFAKANNLALPQCKGKYLLLINPDSIVQEDTFKVMIEFFEKNPDVGMAGCKILNPDGTLQLACRRSFPTPWVALTKITGLSVLFPNSKWFGRYNLTYLNLDESYEVDAISGSFMMLRREVYVRVGGLDEQFFLYGEDLDWCYRIQQAGWKIYYVHNTQIIHYKGESVKRGNIDELKMFYQAMHLFVQKHFSGSLVLSFLLWLGIVLRAGIAFLAKLGKPLLMAFIDVLVIDLSLLLGEYLRFGEFFHFPHYAYPVVLIVPPSILVSVLYFLGVYTYRKFSISRTALSAVIGFFILSSLTFFFKTYAFSRAVVLMSGAINFVLLPGWRLIFRIFARARSGGRPSLFGHRTLIVGVGNSGQELLRKLRTRVVDGYDVVGFIDVNRQRLGEKISGMEILGSVDNIGKIIHERKVSEVIFSTDSLPYSDILAVIGRSRERSVNFRLVPNSLEVIIGKTHIDQLEDIPLVDIEYNIDKPMNRFTKRAFDITVSLFLLLTIYPFFTLKKLLNGRASSPFAEKILLLPSVFKGELSLVGRPFESMKNLQWNGKANSALYLGKMGFTGLVQIHRHDELTQEEVEQYILYYAKNQSLLFDLEILLKSVTIAIRKSKGET